MHEYCDGKEGEEEVDASMVTISIEISKIFYRSSIMCILICDSQLG